MINHDLLAALATLAPGGTHELHPPSPGQPSIVVHTALGKLHYTSKLLETDLILAFYYLFLMPTNSGKSIN